MVTAVIEHLTNFSGTDPYTIAASPNGRFEFANLLKAATSPGILGGVVLLRLAGVVQVANDGPIQHSIPCSRTYSFPWNYRWVVGVFGVCAHG
ncbi:hypothetical protein GJ688_18850 [Heliobacillus mobilis]|uniref:Uncharacterized protein n=1 Tax=Heliobacterium mobile TaxID=28064 RepID=A0A6I3SQ04_HELMO|nr:hypothetical protein [Heliobacterium mobile]